MATITQNSAVNLKALIRKRGWTTTVKIFRRKRDARDWVRRIEDEMRRGVYVARDVRLKTRNPFGRLMSASQVRPELALLSHRAPKEPSARHGAAAAECQGVTIAL